MELLRNLPKVFRQAFDRVGNVFQQLTPGNRHRLITRQGICQPGLNHAEALTEIVVQLPGNPSTFFLQSDIQYVAVLVD